MSTKSQNKKSTKSPKINKKIVISAAAVLLAAFAVSLIPLLNRKNTIAIYGLGEPQTEAIKSQLLEISEEKKLGLDVLILSNEKSISSQLNLSPKTLAVITTSGYAMESAVKKANKKAGVSFDLTSEMTSSMRNSAILNENKKVAAIPLLSDNLEIDIDTQAFRTSGMEAIATWNDITTFGRIQKRRIDFPLAFAGSDGQFFLDLLGGFAEAFDGQTSYNKAAEILRGAAGKKFDAVEIAKNLADNPDSPLITSIRFLKNWYKNGILNANTFSLSKKDIDAFVANSLAYGIFMTLSDHRNTENKISNYSSIYFPSDKSASSRTFTSSTIYAVSLKKSKSVEKLISDLVSADGQEKLSRATGFAPVLSHCRTPDKQADDVRYWIAATNPPNAGLGHEAYFTKEHFRQLGKELAARVIY